MRVLISVYNKASLAEFARELSNSGFEIISTGGTFKFLAEAGIKNLKKVQAVTGFPEIMDGRVKTLHPKVFGGLLADRSKPNHLQEAQNNGIELIDMVVCNLYPFAKTVAKPGVSAEEIIENIDIGGVSLIRAAAKNYQDVMVVVDPEDYNQVLEKLKTPAYAKALAGRQNSLSSGARRAEGEKLKAEDILELRKSLAKKAFTHIAQYDQAIADYFSLPRRQAGGQKDLNLSFEKISDLRYGENPHQTAVWYKETNFSGTGIVNAEMLHGKELSYNNIMDADAALNLISEFNQPAAAVIKHTNPCGCAVADDITEAFIKAYAADSLSAFGGVIVLNRECNFKIAREINKVFAEIVLAPEFEKKALEILKQKKNIRLLKFKVQGLKLKSNIKDYKKIIGGLLVQDYNNSRLDASALKIVTEKKPTAGQLEDLLFAWPVVKHVKSNAIVLVKRKVTVGVGAGQMSRVDSVNMALTKAGSKAKGSVAASDAFFPFRDGLDKLARLGVTAVIQPGGSLKDDEVIRAADEQGLAMVFTGFRAFKH